MSPTLSVLDPRLLMLPRFTTLPIVLLMFVAAVRTASADPAPAAPRIMNMPIAAALPSGEVFVTGGGFGVPQFAPFAGVALGLGGIATVDVELHDRWGCAVCDDTGVIRSLRAATAGFKMGLPRGTVAPWQPNVALAFRVPIGAADAEGFNAELRAARLTLLSSVEVSIFEFHAGLDAWQEGLESEGAGPRLAEPGVRWRPAFGLVMAPPAYPKTRLLLDLSWAPIVTVVTTELRGVLGVGARYQALSWGSIELMARHLEGNGLRDVQVGVRLNGSWNLAALR